MRRMRCRCGQTVYFDNHSCCNCGRQLGFDPSLLDMQSEETPGAGLGTCVNRGSAIRCNWLAKPGVGGGYCLSCLTSKTIPTLSKPENRERWRKLESAKRRLLYDLLYLGLPVDETRLKFVFKEDRRTNPNVSEANVITGHASGVITINAAEADEVFREQMRQKMNEPWRTLLGHLRHESGHYYFAEVVNENNLAEARTLFGDESADYAQALDRYYENGPAADWNDQFISVYASSHPAEDWAECWAHYLHMRSVLEVAAEAGFSDSATSDNWYLEFTDLVLSLNEIMRSLGLPDAYPFVLNPTVAAKIDFIHGAIAQRAS